MMMTERQEDWKNVLGSIAESAGEEAELPGKAESGFDGDAFVWAWANYSGDAWAAEAVLRGFPDLLDTGIQTQVIAVARRIASPLTWSADIWSKHLDREAFDSRSEQLHDFEEELPRRLREAFDKAVSVAPELEALHKEKQDRHHQFAEEFGHLFLE